MSVNNIIPYNVNGTPGDTQIIVNWDYIYSTPDPITSASITTFYVRYTNTQTSQTTIATVTAPQTSETIIGLVNGVPYTIDVASLTVDSVQSPYSSPAISVTPSTIPGQPTGLTAISSDTYVDFTWNAPFNGGSNITSYILYNSTGAYSENILVFPTINSQANTYARISGLIYGTNYTFYLYATNINGLGPVSDALSFTATTSNIGPTGATGINGNDGATGASGIDGVTGASGIDGNDGATGASGNDGATGASGRDGNDGNDGATGASGRDGNDGNDGATGASGRDGNDGATGASGRDGNDGNDGATGASGRDGNDGATGARGIDGNDGNDGATGPTGASGLIGPTGASGLIGPTGTSGLIGPTGTSGLIGPTGPMGPMYSPPSPPIVCFVKGTYILTEKGYVLIENLKAGTVLLTNGRIIQNEKLDSLQIHRLVDTKTKLNYPKQQIQWISSFTVNKPDKNSYPICLKRGSIYKDNEKDMPSQDLYVSPEHSICVNNQMIPAKLLVNDQTIFQDTSFKNKSIEYYHIEMPYHCTIISNGLLTESYLDSGNRGIFKDKGVQNKRQTIKRFLQL